MTVPLVCAFLAAFVALFWLALNGIAMARQCGPASLAEHHSLPTLRETGLHLAALRAPPIK